VPWQQLSVRIPAADLPRVEALLRLAGASAIAISDAGDAPILEPDPDTTPLWPELTVRALFADGLALHGISAAIGAAPGAAPMLETISDKAVEASLKQIVRPLEIGPRLTIVGAENLPDSDERALGIHVGLAFGTGQHPTTRLCLEWIDRAMPPGLSVLDFGCGSGLLALAALKLGATRATATDIEPQALQASRRNARLNRLDASLRVVPPDAIAGDDRFDLILANILAEPLIELAPTFAARQPAGGLIVLSGILNAQIGQVRERYATWYDDLAASELEGWAVLTGQRRDEYHR
jgi:ribosomal protein L11 methyltransferase